MLHGNMLRSPYPHAKVKKIDTTEALKIPGVVAVLHSQNTDPIHVGADLFFNPEVRYVGDDVALVVAETERATRDGREAVKVDYDVLPFVVDKMAVLAPNAPLAQDPKSNLVGGKPDVYTRGDIVSGFAQVDVIVEETFSVPNAHHTTLETHSSVVKYTITAVLASNNQSRG